MISLIEFVNNVTDGNICKTAEFTPKALDAQMPAKEILDNGLLLAMNRIGDSFEKGEIFLSELLMAEDAMKASLQLLWPEPAKKGTSHAGKYARNLW